MKKFLVLILCMVLQNVYGAARDAAREDRERLLPAGAGNPFGAPGPVAGAGAIPVGAAAPRLGGAAAPGVLDLQGARRQAADRQARGLGEVQAAAHLGQQVDLLALVNARQAVLDLPAAPAGGLADAAIVTLGQNSMAGCGFSSRALGDHMLAKGNAVKAAAGHGRCWFFGCLGRSHRFCCGSRSASCLSSRCGRGAMPWVEYYEQAEQYYRTAQIQFNTTKAIPIPAIGTVDEVLRGHIGAMTTGADIQSQTIDASISDSASKYSGSLCQGQWSSIGVGVLDAAIAGAILLGVEVGSAHLKQHSS